MAKNAFFPGNYTQSFTEKQIDLMVNGEDIADTAVRENVDTLSLKQEYLCILIKISGIEPILSKDKIVTTE